MKKTQFKRNTMCLFFVALLLSTSTFAQLICEIGDRDRFYDIFDEYSGLAYHPKENILIIPLDSPTPFFFQGNPSYTLISLKGYNLDDESDFPIRISNFIDFLSDEAIVNQDGTFSNQPMDFEGITHLKDDYFVLLEEDENKIYFLEYVPNIVEAFDGPEFKILSAHSTDIELTADGDGLEGISYDPYTERLYVVMEYENNDGRLFSAPLTLPGAGSMGDIDEAIFNTSNVGMQGFGINDAAGLFHLGQAYPANSALSNNILVVSKFSETMLEFDVLLNEENNLFNGSLNLKNKVLFNEVPSEVHGPEPKPGGVLVVEDKIYIASETVTFLGGPSNGGLSSYTIKKSENDSCDDGNTIYDENCECVEKPDCVAEISIQENVDEESSLQTLYESSESIDTKITASPEVDVIIRENEAVDLKSDHITLNEGFKVENGACLNATIEPCE